MVDEFKFLLVKDYPTYDNYALAIKSGEKYLTYKGDLMDKADFLEQGYDFVELDELDITLAIKDRFEQWKNEKNTLSRKRKKQG